MRLCPLLAAATSALAFAACAAFDSADGDDPFDPTGDAAADAPGDAASSSDGDLQSTGPDSGEGGLPDGGEPVYGNPSSEKVACGPTLSCGVGMETCCGSGVPACDRVDGGSGCGDAPAFRCDGDEDCETQKGSNCAAHAGEVGCVDLTPLSADSYLRTCHTTADCQYQDRLRCTALACGAVTIGVCVPESDLDRPLRCEDIPR